MAYAASDRYKASSLRSHRMDLRVEFSLDGGASFLELDRYGAGQYAPGFESVLTGGQITATRTGLVTRFGQVEFGNVPSKDGLAPAILGATSLLRISRGIRWGRSEVEWVPLATVRPVQGSWDNFSMSLQIEDDLSRLAGDPFLLPWTMPAAVDSYKLLRYAIWDGAVTGLPAGVTSALTPTFTRPFVSHVAASGGATMPVGVEWEDRDALVTAIGTLNGRSQIYLDRLGELRLRPYSQSGSAPDEMPTGQPVQVVHKKQWNLDGFANLGACRYDNAGTPAVATAAASGGGMEPADLGFRQTRVWDVTDSGGSAVTAGLYATDALEAGYGLKKEWEVEILPAVWLDPGDRVTLQCPIHGNTGDFLIDSITYPLTASGTMTLRTREWRGGLA